LKIGYIRVSTADQNTARQEVLMEQLGVDQVYIDKMSGKNTNRPELERMMNFVREGDTVIVESISRFARNTLDCLKYIRQLKDKNIAVFFEKESINTLDAKGEVMLTIRASLAQQESQSISQNVRLGLQYRYQQEGFHHTRCKELHRQSYRYAE
jgi:DNA invertase Pin-like site-specific DNA recombinase